MNTSTIYYSLLLRVLMYGAYTSITLFEFISEEKEIEEGLYRF